MPGTDPFKGLMSPARRLAYLLTEQRLGPRPNTDDDDEEDDSGDGQKTGDDNTHLAGSDMDRHRSKLHSDKKRDTKHKSKCSASEPCDQDRDRRCSVSKNRDKSAESSDDRHSGGSHKHRSKHSCARSRSSHSSDKIDWVGV